jgi:hypothetical protein
MPTDPRFDALRARLPPRPRPGVYLGLVIRAFPVTPRLLEVDRRLQAWHRAGLRAFVDSHREADRGRIRVRDTDREAGGARMRAGLLGGAQARGGDGAGRD